MAVMTDTTERFSVADFGDEISSITRRIEAERLMLVGLQSEQVCPDLEDVFQALLDIQVSAMKIDKGYDALGRERFEEALEAQATALFEKHAKRRQESRA